MNCHFLEKIRMFKMAPADFLYPHATYFSMKPYVAGIHWKCLFESLLMSSHTMFQWRYKKNIM